jgi:hypothetical protein
LKDEEMMAVERSGKLELRPLTQCIYCLSHDHMLAHCPEKHDCFMLTGNDEKFLRSCAIWYPRWNETTGDYVSDPYYDPRRIN